jgi:hypothetical protein
VAFIAHISFKKFPASAGILKFINFMPLLLIYAGTAGINLASEAAAA